MTIRLDYVLIIYANLYIDRLVLKYLTFHPRLYDQQLISHLTWLQDNPPPPASLIDQMDI